MNLNKIIALPYSKEVSYQAHPSLLLSPIGKSAPEFAAGASLRQLADNAATPRTTRLVYPTRQAAIEKLNISLKQQFEHSFQQFTGRKPILKTDLINPNQTDFPSIFSIIQTTLSKYKSYNEASKATQQAIIQDFFNGFVKRIEQEFGLCSFELKETIPVSSGRSWYEASLKTSRMFQHRFAIIRMLSCPEKLLSFMQYKVTPSKLVEDTYEQVDARTGNINKAEDTCRHLFDNKVEATHTTDTYKQTFDFLLPQRTIFYHVNSLVDTKIPGRRITVKQTHNLSVYGARQLHVSYIKSYPKIYIQLYRNFFQNSLKTADRFTDSEFSTLILRSLKSEETPLSDKEETVLKKLHRNKKLLNRRLDFIAQLTGLLFCGEVERDYSAFITHLLAAKEAEESGITWKDLLVEPASEYRYGYFRSLPKPDVPKDKTSKAIFKQALKKGYLKKVNSYYKVCEDANIPSSMKHRLKHLLFMRKQTECEQINTALLNADNIKRIKAGDNSMYVIIRPASYEQLLALGVKQADGVSPISKRQYLRWRSFAYKQRDHVWTRNKRILSEMYAQSLPSGKALPLILDGGVAGRRKAMAKHSETPAHYYTYRTHEALSPSTTTETSDTAYTPQEIKPKVARKLLSTFNLITPEEAHEMADIERVQSFTKIEFEQTRQKKSFDVQKAELKKLLKERGKYKPSPPDSQSLSYPQFLKIKNIYQPESIPQKDLDTIYKLKNVIKNIDTLAISEANFKMLCKALVQIKVFRQQGITTREELHKALEKLTKTLQPLTI